MSLVFGFQEDSMLVSYCPERKKVVLVLSVMHHDDAIDEETGNHKKPEMITYNMTEIGADLLSQICPPPLPKV
jgi:hypothetical protein